MRRISHWLSLVASLAAGAALAGPTVYGESAMVKVRPSTAPHADAGVSLTGARNEFVSFQVVIHGGDSGATHVGAAFPGLQGPGSIGGTDVTLYREAYLNITTPTFRGGQTGQWPDALIPDVDEIVGEKRSAFPFDVPAGQARAVWVDVHIPADAKPGKYSGAVVVTGNGVSARVPVALTVVNVLMPSTPSLATAFLLKSNEACAAHFGRDCGGAQLDQLLSRYQRMALEHRITLPNLPHYVPTGDWSGFDASYGPYIDGTAPSRLAGAKMTSVQYPGPVNASSYANFAQHFRAKGWLDRAYDYTIDEPHSASAFNQAMQRAAIVHQGAPDMRTLVTTTVQEAQAHGLLSSIDLMTPVVDQLYGFSGDQRPQYEAYLKLPHKGVWMYQSCDSFGCGGGQPYTPNSGWPTYMVDVSAAKNRAMQWIDFRERVSGELYYATMMALPTAWTDVHLFGGNGDGTLFYPGTTGRIGGKTDVPVASIRLKLIRLGVQDYEWLKMVSDAGDPTFARKLVDSIIPSAHQVPDDGALFEKARMQLIARLAQLRPSVMSDIVGTGDGTSGDGLLTGTPASDTASGASAGSTSGGGASGVTSAGVTSDGDASGVTSAGGTATPGSASPGLTPGGSTAMTAGGCSATPGSLALSPALLLLGAFTTGVRRRLSRRRDRSSPSGS